MVYLAGVGGVLGLFAVIFWFMGFKLIHDNEVGIVTKKMFGKTMPEGQIIARNGEVGIQAQTLMPGLVWRNPVSWKVEKVPVTDIEPNEIGVVESVDGEPITMGRLLGDAVECNSYQDAKKFLDDHGKKGPQVGILKPGTYRINTKVFTVTKKQITSVPKEKVGVAVALDGIPLPTGYIVAPRPVEEADETHKNVKPHKSFQEGQAFLDSKGYRGPQLDTLQPGDYYINPLLFKIQQYDVAEVPPGYVAVLRSNVGQELDRGTDTPKDVTASPDLKQPIHEDAETLLIPNRDKRGIWKDPVAPGKYNLNPIAFTPYLVPTSAVTIDWAAGSELRSDLIGAKSKGNRDLREDVESEKATEFFKFSQLRVTSMDGFQLDVDVRMVIRVRPEYAAFIIARFGSVINLIEQIVHPLIDSSFRNKAGEKKAINFFQARAELQREALEKAREEFKTYHVEAQNLLIAYIAVDKALLDTQTKKEIALQQQEQYKQEAASENERIQVQERKARADKQPDVVAAQLSIKIAEDKAEALRKEASGVSDATSTKAEGEASAVERVGAAHAKVYRMKARVLGPQATSLIEVVDEIGRQKVVITPKVLVTGGNDGQSNNLITATLASMLATGQWPTMESLAEDDNETKEAIQKTVNAGETAEPRNDAHEAGEGTETEHKE